MRKVGENGSFHVTRLFVAQMLVIFSIGPFLKNQKKSHNFMEKRDKNHSIL